MQNNDETFFNYLQIFLDGMSLPTIKTKPDGSKVVSVEEFLGKSERKCEVIGSFLENILRKHLKEPPSEQGKLTAIGIEKNKDGVTSIYIELSLFELMELKQMHKVISKLTNISKSVIGNWKSDGSKENATYTSTPHNNKTWELYLLKETIGHIKAFHSDAGKLTKDLFMIDAVKMKNDSNKIILISREEEIKPLLDMEGIEL